VAARFSDYLRTPTGRTALAVVVAFGLMLGYFVSRTYVNPLPRQYYIDFRDARWIQMPTPAHNTYFRKDIYIPGNVERAWIAVATTGSYEIMVNNVKIDEERYPGARLTTVQDITVLLSSGKNVIAIFVPGDSSDGPRQVLVRGAYQVAGAPPIEFVSDSSWKVSAAASDIPGVYTWSAAMYDDALWSNAEQASSGERWSTVQQVAFDPRLFTLEPAGKWIASPTDRTGHVTFWRELNLLSEPSEAWLQLASNGAYDVVVNGNLAVMTTTASEAFLFGPNSPVALGGDEVVENRDLPTIIGPVSGLPGSKVYSESERSQSTSSQQSGTASSTSNHTSSSGSSRGASTGGAATSQNNVASSTGKNGSVSYSLQGKTITTAAATGSGGSSQSGTGTQSAASNSASFFQSGTATQSSSTSNSASFFQSGAGSQSSANSSGGNSIQSSTGTQSATQGSAASSTTSSSQQQANLAWNPIVVLQPASSVSPARIIVVPFNQDASPLAPPSLGGLAPQPAQVAPQTLSRSTSPGPIMASAIALTDYDISTYLKPGKNLIAIRAHAEIAPAALLVSGFVELADGTLSRFGTDDRWQAHFASAEGRSNSEIPVMVVGGYADQPYGPPVQVAADPNWLPSQDVRTVASWIVTLAGVTGAVVLLWFFVPLVSGAKSAAERRWNRAATFHLPMLIALVWLWLLSCDVRFPYDWCFRPIVVIVFAAGLLAWHLAFALLSDRMPADGAPFTGDAARGRWVLCGGLLVLITIIGAMVRASGLISTPLGHDEAAMAMLSRSIPLVGFPYLMAGSYTRLMSTYELVPYPMALFSVIIGPTVLAYRLPAFIFGSLAIALIGWCGRRMFDWRVGLTAAAIWAFLPIPVNWSRDGFYPTQELFFALATFWLFFEAIRDRGINARYMRLTAVAFLLTYFSWEACAFILPTLFVAILVLKWGEWDWISDAHLWRCFGVISTIVIVQLCYRQFVLVPSYLGVIKDLSEISAPGLVMFDRLVFDPLYYIDTLFMAENHLVLTLVALVGLIFSRSNLALMYLYVSLVMLYVCYTCFLDHYAPRYCLNWLPLLVLAACGSFFALWDQLAAIPARRFAAALKTGAQVGALVLLILSANEYVLKLFRITPDPTNPVWYDRIGVPFKADYKLADEFVARNLKPGDVVIAATPHVYQFVTGRKPDYAINTLLVARMFYDGGMGVPTYIDKWLGIPVLRSLDDLKDVQQHASRVWVIDSTRESSSDPAEALDVVNYLNEHGQRVFESSEVAVDLLDGARDSGKSFSSPAPARETAAAELPVDGRK